LRIVPTADFRNGIFTYLRNDGSVGELTPDQVKAIDPAHIGADPGGPEAAPELSAAQRQHRGRRAEYLRLSFQRCRPAQVGHLYRQARLSRGRSRQTRDFLAGQPAKRSLHPDNSGAINVAGALPQFPGDPPSSVSWRTARALQRVHGLAHPDAHQQFALRVYAPGPADTGVLDSSYTELRDIDDRYATSTGLTRIVPVHDVGEDLAWAKGAPQCDVRSEGAAGQQ